MREMRLMKGVLKLWSGLRGNYPRVRMSKICGFLCFVVVVVVRFNFGWVK